MIAKCVAVAVTREQEILQQLDPDKVTPMAEDLAQWHQRWQRPRQKYQRCSNLAGKQQCNLCAGWCCRLSLLRSDTSRDKSHCVKRTMNFYISICILQQLWMISGTETKAIQYIPYHSSSGLYSVLQNRRGISIAWLLLSCPASTPWKKSQNPSANHRSVKSTLKAIPAAHLAKILAFLLEGDWSSTKRAAFIFDGTLLGETTQCVVSFQNAVWIRNIPRRRCKPSIEKLQRSIGMASALENLTQQCKWLYILVDTATKWHENRLLLKIIHVDRCQN